MKRILFLAALLIIPTATGVSGGPANYVHHFGKNGEKVIFASAGSCRHHLSAHPNDYMIVVGGVSQDPLDCQ